MDLPWGHEARTKFITNVGLITTAGPNGPNIMAAEWTYQLSYSPGLLAVSIGHGKATAENIRATGNFGVSMASVKQTGLASIAGNYSGKEYDKIGALKELGFGFYDGKKINVLMVKGASLNVECKLVGEIPAGDHTLFVGEVLDFVVSSEQSIGYSGGRYILPGPDAEKPSEKERKRIKTVIERHKKTLAVKSS
ncbi:MAG: flavin reductase family protein [Candidatus Aenigmarchaeota archaeon]|nr:flavin reductase family protein [Candidatus Aenigmarchaeota archaeon]